MSLAPRVKAAEHAGEPGQVKSPALAVLGADDPAGVAFLQLLEEREIPIGRLFPLSLHETDSTVAYQGRDWPCEPVEGFDFGQVQVLVAVGRSAATARVLGAIRSAHAQLAILAAEHTDPAPAHAVARLLKVLGALGGAVSADVFLALPVADLGQAGVEELASQTRGLFSMESPEPEVFPLQIAFNLIPHGVSTEPDLERTLEAAMERLAPGARVHFSVIWAPLFYGSCAMLHAHLTDAVDVEGLRQAFRHRDDLVLMEADLAAGTPTPATDAQGSDKVFVSRIRVEGGCAKFWLVFDSAWLEASMLADGLENWIDYPARSMLT